MSNKLFNKKEIEIFKSNINIKIVTIKGITYTDEFKRIFIEEKLAGALPRHIFEKHGLDVEILGIRRIKDDTSRWRK